MSSSAVAALDAADKRAVGLDIAGTYTLVAAFGAEVGRTCGHDDRDLVMKRLTLENWIGVCGRRIADRVFVACGLLP